MTHLEKGVVRTPSTLVREGTGTVLTVATIKELVERKEGIMVETAILSTSTVEEVRVSRGSEAPASGRDESGFDLPFLCGMSEGTGEKCFALGASLVVTMLSVAFKAEELGTEVVDSTEVVTEPINGVLLLDRVDEGM